MLNPSSQDTAGDSVAHTLVKTAKSPLTKMSLQPVSNDADRLQYHIRSVQPAPLRRRSDKYGAGRSVDLQALLVGALDEIDYGMIMIDSFGRVCHANRNACTELGQGRYLLMDGDRLVACAFEQREVLTNAISRASRGGARSLVELGPIDSTDAGLTVAVVPIGQHLPNSSLTSAVLVITGKQQICEHISLQFFARRYALSRSEEIVLLGLVQGYSVQEVAIARGLALSTVRSQVKDIRIKTRCKSVRELLGKVSALPPLVHSI